MIRSGQLRAGSLLLWASLQGCSGWPLIPPPVCRPQVELLIQDQPGMTRTEIVSELLRQHQIPPVAVGVKCMF